MRTGVLRQANTLQNSMRRGIDKMLAARRGPTELSRSMLVSRQNLTLNLNLDLSTSRASQAQNAGNVAEARRELEVTSPSMPKMYNTSSVSLRRSPQTNGIHLDRPALRALTGKASTTKCTRYPFGLKLPSSP
jgi:hypothetical protein